jgi:hypothetical protein
MLMPTSERAARVLGPGAADKSDPLFRSSLRIAKLIVRKAPNMTPNAIVTPAMMIRLAMTASGLLDAVVSRGLSLGSLPRYPAGLTCYGR